MTDLLYQPKPEHKFTFGLWTVANVGRDPLGEPTRPSVSPVDLVEMLGEIGAYGVNFHDNDLAPVGAISSEGDRIEAPFRKALKSHAFDRVGLGKRGMGYERLDQPVIELLLGVR